MFGKIALFELRYQFRNPVFWVAAIIFFLLTFGAATSDDIQIGGGGNITSFGGIIGNDGNNTGRNIGL